MSALHWVPAWSDPIGARVNHDRGPLKTACGRRLRDAAGRRRVYTCATSDRDFSCSPEGRCRRCWKAWRAI